MATFFTSTALDAALDAAVTADTVSLHTGSPGAAGALNELTGMTAPNYARQSITFDSAASGEKDSSIDVDFLADGGDWPAVTHLGLWDGVTFVGWIALNSALQADDGETVHFATGDINVTGAGA